MTAMDAGNGGALKLTEDMQAAISGTEHALHRAGIEPGSLSAQSVIFLAGYRMGQQAMRERAATVCTKHDTGDMQREDMEARRIADAIRSLPVEE